MQRIYELEKEIDFEKHKQHRSFKPTDNRCFLDSDKNDNIKVNADSLREQSRNIIKQSADESDNIKYLSNEINEKRHGIIDTSKADNEEIQNSVAALQGSAASLALPLPWWESGNCSAGDDFVSKEIIKNLRGTCGVRSSNWGPGQKVISYCFYGKYYKRYASGLPDIIKTAQHLYPGWIIRLYTTVPDFKAELCPILGQYPNFHLCDIERLPGDHQNLSEIEPMLWRMAPMADELVEVFISRDLDAWVRTINPLNLNSHQLIEIVMITKVYRLGGETDSAIR